MKFIFFSFIFLGALRTIAQEQKEAFDAEHWQPPYQMIVPEDWSIERFSIPIDFAPTIHYTGVEDLRFTPGWGDAKSPDYWTYAYLWFLEGKHKLTAKHFAQNLTAYYSGLVGRNIEPRHIPKEKLFPVTASFKKIKTLPGDAATFRGRVHMLDYMQQKPVTLNCLAHVKHCNGKDNTYVFYEISPQSLTHAVWKSMDNIWREFICDQQ